MKFRDLPRQIKIPLAQACLAEVPIELRDVVSRLEKDTTVESLCVEVEKVVDRLYGDTDVDIHCTEVDNNSDSYLNTISKRHNRDIIEDIKTDGKSFVSGKLVLSKSDWSREFAHGADSLVQIHALIEEILASGEKITLIRDISWKKPMQSNIRMVAYDRQLNPEEIPHDITVEGSFKTSNNRTIYFYGVQDQSDPITMSQAVNPYAILKEKINFFSRIIDSNNHEYSIGSIDYDLPARIVPATIAELLTIAVSSSFSRQFGDRDLALAASISSVVIPEDYRSFAARTPKIKCRFNTGKTRQGKSGMSLIPCEFSIDGVEGTALMAVTRDKSIAMKVYN